MSLVAYGSSGEDSDIEDENEVIVKPSPATSTAPVMPNANAQPIKRGLQLPQPKQQTENIESNGLHLNLPKPTQGKNGTVIEEEDDEFLHKKVAPSLIAKPVPDAKRANRKPVKITIPSLSEFDDTTSGKKLVTVDVNPTKPSGLLNMLPAPKNYFPVAKSSDTAKSLDVHAPSKATTTSLVPHSVANRRKQAEIKTKPLAPSTSQKPSLLSTSYGDSDNSDNENDDGGDFFSLNNETKLPEISASEINAMVAKRAAKMAETSKKLQEEATASVSQTIEESVSTEYAQPSTSSKLVTREEIDIQALCGARAAKRARKEDIKFIEISQDQVTLSREEWLRNQLQAETEYQPRGLADAPGAGTKKKHQITYLAYQAKANEAELQAMWAASRQNRRQTQSKYGF